MSARRPLLAREVVLAHRRRRILAGTASACAEWGYRGATIEDVISHAGVSRNSIYQQYANKEAIFLDLLQASVEELRSGSESACAEAGPDRWDQVAAAVSSVLSWIAANPDPAGALLCEADCAGRAAWRIKDAGVRWYVDQLLARIPRDSPASARTAELAVGGIASILGFRAFAGDTAGLPDLGDSLVTFLRTPFEPV